MLHELVVRNLGVIESASVVLRPGLTAITGETGAGKTLVTGALLLLAGGRADPAMVRAGADEAEVEGRFVWTGPGDEPNEVIVRRVIPADGRSRAYLDGRLATAAAIGETVGDLIDLHGQHGQQTLLRGPARRGALDRFGDIDTTELVNVRLELAEAVARRSEFGGDSRARARELELLTFQVEEIAEAAIEADDEDEVLRRDERILGDASAHRDAAIGAGSLLSADGTVGDGLARALALIDGREPFAESAERLRNVIAEVGDIAAELRGSGEGITDDPARLAAISERRRQLGELRRKYGATLADVVAFEAEAKERLNVLEGWEQRAAALEDEIAALQDRLRAIEASVGHQRRAAAPQLADRVQGQLRELALPAAVVEVSVGDDPGDDVDFLVSTNAGTPPMPIAKVASGGELSRVMLALQLVVASAPPLMVFDEVDAGVGGQAATAVGQALARVATGRQVLVVTHLPQVAAYATHHIRIEKRSEEASATTSLVELDAGERIVELSRMLSGEPDSATAQSHAAELLEKASGNQQ